jgi:hypothetical protein
MLALNQPPKNVTTACARAIDFSLLACTFTLPYPPSLSHPN